MQSLLTLTAVIAMLATYLESTIQPVAASLSQPIIAKVIRTNITATTPKAIYKPAKATPTVPLNLNVPSLDNIQQHYFSHQAPTDYLFQPQDAQPEVSYSAELVFDAEKGEDVTGGRVNITIPLS